MRLSRAKKTRPLVGGGFADFYAEHADALAVWFARRTLDPETAVELAAETFAQAYLGRRRFRGQSEASAAAWLYGIARHQLSRYHRRGQAEQRALRRAGLELPPLERGDIERLEHEAELSGIRAELGAALKTITSEQRDAIQLRIVEELPYEEVASRLGSTEQAARARVSRGLRSLQRFLNASRSPDQEVVQ